MRVAGELEKLRKVAATTENVLPQILECVRVYATVGEMVDGLKEIFGEYPVFTG